MNYAFLPDLAALAVLIVILGVVRLRHSQERANAWLLGLMFTLVESAVHTFYPPGVLPGRVLHLIVLDCSLLSGLIFVWAGGDQRFSHNTRLIYLAMNGLPLLVLTTTYGLNLRYPQAYVPAIILGLVLGVASSVRLRGNWTNAILFVLGWTTIGVLVAHGDYRPAVYWGAACVFLVAALNFQHRLDDRSTGKLAIVPGFCLWAVCMAIHPWVVDHPAYSDLAAHFWNMQKSLIAIGMVLVMLEEQVTNHARLALHDELTGLPNRRMFASALGLAIDQCDRRKTSLAVVILDLDGFKKINDTLGHHAGDHVLREVSAALRRSVRASDTVARLGGDEFIIVAAGMASASTVQRFVDSVRSSIERPIDINGQSMLITASLGSALYPEDADDATKLVRVADQRMYSLKKKPVQQAQGQLSGELRTMPPE